MSLVLVSKISYFGTTRALFNFTIWVVVYTHFYNVKHVATTFRNNFPNAKESVLPPPVYLILSVTQISVNKREKR